jgi:TRAP transporter TAXI family solute receptor
MFSRRSVLVGAAGVAGAVAAHADDITYFRILTGGTVGAYFPIGGLIASAISDPPRLVATTIASSGSVANVTAIESGTAQSAFVQSDVAYWAHTGTGTYEGRPQAEALRAIASLYPESIQLVARKGSGIRSVADLRGKRVSLDEPGSGTLADARTILGAYGLTERDLEAVYLPVQRAADRLRGGALDAFFNVSAWPQSTIADLAASPGIDLVPIGGSAAVKLTSRHKFFVAGEIPDNAYEGVAGVKTINIHALWITSSKQSAKLIYRITTALWMSATRKLLESGPPIGRDIRLETALLGVSIPLHAGAERFYMEKGLIN